MRSRRDLPLSALRAFESAGQHLHLGRAGKALGVTHGAISHQIRLLENRLGIRLFTRERNRLQLTPAGERLLKAVQRGFDQILDGVLHLDPDSLSGSLVIGCTQSAAANWAIKHIMDFKGDYPDVAVEVVEIAPGQLNIPREVDLAICYGRPNTADRRIELLAEPPIFPVGSPSLLYAAARIRKPDDLLSLPLLDDGQNAWDRWFEAMGIVPLEAIKMTRFFNTTLALTAARQGYGVALGNPFEIDEDLKEGRLIKLLDRSVPESRNYYLLAHHQAKESLRGRLFEDWIRRRMSSQGD